MGLTAVALIYSPWGKRSGAHMNPAFTLAFRRLGRIGGWDTLFYICAQFAGGVLGVAASALVLGAALADPRVNYAVTVPGPAGVAAAALAELLISAGLIAMVLQANASPRLERLTGLFAGLLIALYILFEAPFSGMSMNPARSFGSAIVADVWPSFWLYLVAPPLGMLAVAEFHLLRRRPAACAKLHHANSQRCIFCGANGGF
jgi:aquaporin Z